LGLIPGSRQIFGIMTGENFDLKYIFIHYTNLIFKSLKQGSLKINTEAENFGFCDPPTVLLRSRKGFQSVTLLNLNNQWRSENVFSYPWLNPVTLWWNTFAPYLKQNPQSASSYLFPNDPDCTSMLKSMKKILCLTI